MSIERRTLARGAVLSLILSVGVLAPTPVLAAFSGYYRVVARHSGLSLTVAGANTANAGNVIQSTYTSAAPANDEWSLVDVGSGYYRIIARHSGKVLDVTGGSTADKANVQQYAWANVPQQQWQPIDVGSGYYRVTARHSGKVLDVTGASLADGANIQQHGWANVPQQQWQFVPVGTAPTPTPLPPSTPTMANLIPKPVSATPAGGTFSLTSAAQIHVEPATAEITNIGQFLADKLNPATGFSTQVAGASGAPGSGIYLTTANGDSSLGTEGYELTVQTHLVTLRAFRPTGLFRGLQTIRQLLPAAIDSASVRPGPWLMAAGTVRDYPRFAWRGTMLDVARHFHGLATVQRYIDQIALYKMNRFHMHLSDDQGWRIFINSWPNLAVHGGSTQVGGGPGGYFTQADYQAIVSYAARRYITVVPEIDMPGHTNAALSSYASLNCDAVAPPLYTGTGVGFSTLCVPLELTYDFVGDVVGEIAGLSPGSQFHIGGDESRATTRADYLTFLDRTYDIVASKGKTVMGWEDISAQALPAGAVCQHWHSAAQAQSCANQGAKIVMSPQGFAYLDHRYNSGTIGHSGDISVQKAYRWNPGTQVSGVPESSVLGVEGPLWSEYVVTRNDVDFLAFPRVIGLAELGWSPVAGRSWDEYKFRLGSHGPRLTELGVNFYRAAEVPWSPNPTPPGPTPTPTPTPTSGPRPTPTATPTPTPAPTGPAPDFVEITPGAAGVTASTSDDNAPANTIDGDLGTRWSASGDGAWIRYDLGSVRPVAHVSLAVYNGNTRQNRFDLQVSNDGATWTNVLTDALTTGTTTAEEIHDFADVDARYIRYLGHMSTVGTFNSLTEVSVFSSAVTPADVDLTPGGAAAMASANDGNVPANAVDHDLSTRWSANGDAAWLQLDLGTTRTVGSVKISTFNGNTRRARFDLQVAVTAGNWSDVLTNVESSGTTTALEAFDFTDVPARWVRYVGHGNSDPAKATWNSVSELNVWGR